MKTTLLLTTCILTAGGLMVKNTAADVLSRSNSATTYKVKTLSASKRMSANPVPPIYMVIDKRKYELSVYDSKGWFATYPVVFGNNSLADKKMEGDRNTPEGTFKINAKRPHEKWDRFISIDYPNEESIAKFNVRKQRGEIPSWAKPGGGIGIHGTWPDDDYVVDHFRNWTNGCISLKRHDIKDLYSYIPVGTPVVIRR